MKFFMLVILIAITSFTLGKAMADESLIIQGSKQIKGQQTLSPQGASVQSFKLADNDIPGVSMKCGFAPFPPLGCSVGSCVCDQSGKNCHWTFNCN